MLRLSWAVLAGAVACAGPSRPPWGPATPTDAGPGTATVGPSGTGPEGPVDWDPHEGSGSDDAGGPHADGGSDLPDPVITPDGGTPDAGSEWLDSGVIIRDAGVNPSGPPDGGWDVLLECPERRTRLPPCEGGLDDARWLNEPLLQNPNVSSGAKYAVDRGGFHHVVYGDGHGLWYGTDRKGAWAWAFLAPLEYVRRDARYRIALNDCGTPYVLHHSDRGELSLLFPVAGGSWRMEPLPLGERRGDRSADLVIDAQGRVHVFATVAGIRSYLTYADGAWRTQELLGTVVHSLRPVSLALDAKGLPVASYVTYSARPAVIRLTDSGWVDETLSVIDVVGDHVVRVDSAGTTHVVWQRLWSAPENYTRGDVMYAFKRAADPGWTHEAVERAGYASNHGRGVDLIVDGLGPRVVYDKERATSGFGTREWWQGYARRDSTGWILDDNTRGVALGPASIGADVGGRTFVLARGLGGLVLRTQQCR